MLETFQTLITVRNFQHPTLNGASVSLTLQFRAATMLLLSTIGIINIKMLRSYTNVQGKAVTDP
jgi:hypothetical protein